jgi:hypothetical protein
MQETPCPSDKRTDMQELTGMCTHTHMDRYTRIFLREPCAERIDHVCVYVYIDTYMYT